MSGGIKSSGMGNKLAADELITITQFPQAITQVKNALGLDTCMILKNGYDSECKMPGVVLVANVESGGITQVGSCGSSVEGEGDTKRLVAAIRNDGSEATRAMAGRLAKTRENISGSIYRGPATK